MSPRKLPCIVIALTAIFCIYATASPAKNSQNGLCLEKLTRPKSPEHLSFLETTSALGTKLQEVEKWINAFKSHFIKELYNQTKGIYSSRLSADGNMSLQTRKETAFGVTVRPLFEGKNIYIAVFWSEDNLTQAQMRTEVFAFGGGDSKAGKLPSPSSLFYHVSCEACRGLKLSGVHYKSFQEELRRQKRAYLPEEKVFFKKIIQPLLAIHPNGDFDIVSINAKSPALDTLIHEAHHAQYDSNPKYKKILLSFWNKNIKGKRDKEIADSFNPKFPTYELLQDEFFAYLLQPKTFGQWNPMDKYKEEFLDKVLSALQSNGQWPLFYPAP